MADDFKEELIGISEKLGKYNQAMQESLNILSDEFLLLRDELSTLNQNLDKTKALDDKLDEFNKTVAVLEKMKGSFGALEKVSESLQVANSLGDKLDELIRGDGATKGRMAEAVLPLSKKMDLLFSKFEDNLAPLNGKIDSLGAAIKIGGGEEAKSLKSDEQLKSLALTIQDELSKLQKQSDENSNSVRSVGASIAYLSENEAEMKKGLDYLTKTYEHDREREAAERARLETEAKKKERNSGEKKLDEIAAVLKVQIEQLQKQEALIEGMRKGGKGREDSALALEEIRKYSPQLEGIQKQIETQTSKINEIKNSMPSGDFGEVIKHADLINQATNSKLETIAELGAKAAKSVDGFNDKMAQLPSLMQNISAALDALVSEMKKSQSDFKNLQGSVQSISSRGQESTGHIEKLESITENIRGLHAKLDEKKEQARTPMQAPPEFEKKIGEVLEELKKFEQIEKERIQQQVQIALQPQKDELSPKMEILISQLKKIEEMVAASNSAMAPIGPGDGAPSASSIQTPFQDNISPKLETLALQLRNMESMISRQSEQISLQIGQSKQIAPITDMAFPRMDAQLISIKKDVAAMNANISSLREAIVGGGGITAEVDFAPLLRKLEEMEGKLERIRSGHEESAGSASGESLLPNEKLIDQRALLDEVQTNIRIFETFELSDRAKIVVDRIAMLVKRAIAIYSA